MKDSLSTFWDEISPSWMFQVGPKDFAHRRPSICPGVYYLPGMGSLLLLHFGCFGLFVNALVTSGYRPCLLLYLVPVFIVWLIFVPADIKFRLQRPTKLERWAFDNSVVNWVGYLTQIGWALLTLASVVAFIVALARHFFS